MYLLGQHPIAKLYLHYDDNLLPVGGVRCVIMCGLVQPLIEVFLLHS